MEYKLYRVIPAYEWFPIDEDENIKGDAEIKRADDYFYAVEVWNGMHYERTEKFFSLEDAQKFIKESQ